MKRKLAEWREMGSRLHTNENGAEAGLERILLIAFIALPLLGLLIYFRDNIATKAKQLWADVTGKSTDLTN
jgi:Flp pilus assembly pilin Flp